MHEDWKKIVDYSDVTYHVCDKTRMDWDVGGPNVRQGSINFSQIAQNLGHKHEAGIYGPGQTFQWRWEAFQQYSKRRLLPLRMVYLENLVYLYWVPGPSGIEVNEKADELAEQCPNTQFIGP